MLDTCVCMCGVCIQIHTYAWKVTFREVAVHVTCKLIKKNVLQHYHHEKCMCLYLDNIHMYWYMLDRIHIA